MIKKSSDWLTQPAWLEEVFRGRNKDYGAYEIRRLNKKNTLLALIMAVGIFLLLIGSGMIRLWYEHLFETPASELYPSVEVSLTAPPAGNQGTLPAPLKKGVQEARQEEPRKSDATPVKPKITREEKPEPPEETKEKQQNSQNGEGKAAVDSGAVHGVSAGSTSSTGQPSDTGAVYTRVSSYPVFAGCDQTAGSPAEIRKCSDQKLRGFIRSQLRYPAQAVKNRTEGIVVVQFIIERDGSVSGIRILKDIGDGCGAETVRVIQLINSMKLYWTPAIQGNYRVRMQYTLPVEFESD